MSVVRIMSPASRRWARRSKVDRLRDRGDVRRLVAILDTQDWLVDRGGNRIDLEVGRRIEAVAALGTIKSRDAEEGVIRGLDDTDPSVRRAAVVALRPRPGMRALKALARAAATWRDPALQSARDAALELLLDVGDELHAVEYTQVLIDDESRPSLTAAEEESVRQLFQADSGPVAEIFANELALALEAHEQAERRVVWQALVAMGPVSVGPLISALDDPNRRHLAATALGALRDTNAIPKFVELLSRADAAGRAAAARALGEIRDPRALEALVRASGDPDAHVRDAAQDALDGMRGVLLAMAGATAFWVEQGRDRGDQVNGVLDAGAPQLGASPRDPRSLLRRLLGRQP
jgi:HEAT repeat protein